MSTSSYKEREDSQVPALKLLQKMGYKYLSPEEGKRHRKGMLSRVFLTNILTDSLQRINHFEYRGEKHTFSQSNIQAAVNALIKVPDKGLVQTNEAIYDLLTLGKSFSEQIDHDQRNFTIKYIDWQNIKNNVFHVTEEFVIEGLKNKRRPDIVLFVNGIPFVVIENKRRDTDPLAAITQHIRNQETEEGVPRLFHFTQLLLAAQPNEIKYGSTGTREKFWSIWKENNDEQVEKLIHSSTKECEAEDRKPTEQDKVLYGLCRHERLMELTYKFVVFDSGERKMARYQQYFAIQNTLKRVKTFHKDGYRKGGLIWHTQGSGKSLTMVMLSKALSLDISNPRVVVVTDRIDLDKQIYATFEHCGKHVTKAQSGKKLIDLLRDKGNEVITTVISKFRSALNQKNFKDDSKDLFVLVDESHRSQYGSLHAEMKRVLPAACYIGFTGTPLMKKEKSTYRKFGGFIHKYTIDQAVKDGAVLPLLYEGRTAKLKVDRSQIDKKFERLTGSLKEETQHRLKAQYATISQIFKSQQVVEEIAYDISKHYSENWQGTGFKAQIAAPSINTAIRYQKYFENQENAGVRINTCVVFTPPDRRDEYFEKEDDPSEESRKYWKEIIEKYGNQEAYENKVISTFKEGSKEIEIIISVNKLLTGFDAPRNTVLYLTKPLIDHNLLQAIARVNRLFEGKEFGYIIDYVGVLGDLDKALAQYSALESFETEDLQGMVCNIKEEVQKIPLRYKELWEIFKKVSNKEDNEALERHLADEDIRDTFYKRLSAFARLLQIAMGADTFYKEFSEQKVTFYKERMKFFENMKNSVQRRYAEHVDYKEYESRIKKLMDSHIHVGKVKPAIPQVDILDKNMMEEQLSQNDESSASRADMIAYQLKKSIHEYIKKDEVFYKKFSELIAHTIEEFKSKRLKESEYFAKITDIKKDFDNGHIEGMPDIVKHSTQARAFYGILKISLAEDRLNEQIGQSGVDIAEIVKGLIIRDWKKNVDIKNQMQNKIEDYIRAKEQEWDIEITLAKMDEILKKCLSVAEHNY